MNTLKKIAVSLALVLFASALALGQAKRNDALEAELIALEKRGFEAWKNKDVKFYQETTTEVAYHVDWFGVLPHEQYLKAISNHPCKMNSYNLDNFKVTRINQETALLTYRYTQDVVCLGKPEPSPIWASTLFIKRGGKWLAAFHQETPATTLFPTATNEPVAQAEQEVRQATQEYDRAYQQQDAAALDRILADDYRLVEYRGNILTKAEMLAQAKAGTVKVETGHSEAVQVRVYGDVALATGRFIEKSTKDGQPFVAGTLQFTTMFLKQNGHWRVLADQVTLIAPSER